MSDYQIKKAAVIGAGTMGSGIAAHMANAGLDVVLLDLDAELAAGGVTRQLKIGGFMEPAFAARVKTGSTKTDLGLLADADWIVEAVAERLDIKHELFRAIDNVRKPTAILTSNTSTIPLHDLLDGFSDEFAAHFLVTHFFNPPRVMRLLELVSGSKTKPSVTEVIARFADEHLGKGVVPCKDRPGFIGNRIGCYWLASGLSEGIRLGIDVQVADSALGKPFGFPKTGIFGLYDLVGIDLMPYLIRSLQSTLPKTDPIQAYEAEPQLETDMLAKGLSGRKGGGGFYKLSVDKKTKEVIDLQTGEYHPQKPVQSDSLDAAKGDARVLLDHPGLAGQYAWAVMSRTLVYAASLVPEIADRPDLVDEAMRLGYGWKYGPFELIDRIGAGWFAEKLAREGRDVPPLLASAVANGGFYRVANGELEELSATQPGQYESVPLPEGVISLAALKLKTRSVASDDAASLWDLGEGVGLLEFHTKMNSFSLALLAAVEKAVVEAPKTFKALVIGNDGPVFSAGADLSYVFGLSEKGDREGIEQLTRAGVKAFDAVKTASLPIVGAAFGVALGGGCEVLLHSAAVVAHSETSFGLVEARVGLVPGWGGVTELLLRHIETTSDVNTAFADTFEAILLGTASAGAFDARGKTILRPSDEIVMNRDRLIAQAKKRALQKLQGFAPAVRRSMTLVPARVFEERLEMLKPQLSPHDLTIAQKLIEILSGSETVTESELTERVTHAFVDLALTQPTRDRITNMLKTGKPLKN